MKENLQEPLDDAKQAKKEREELIDKQIEDAVSNKLPTSLIESFNTGIGPRLKIGYNTFYPHIGLEPAFFEDNVKR